MQNGLSVLQLTKILGHPADHSIGTLRAPHKFWVVRHNNIEKIWHFKNHSSHVAASLVTIGHGLWQQKFSGCQSDQYSVISGSPDRFIGRNWRPLSCTTGLCYCHQETRQMHNGPCYCHWLTRQMQYGLCYRHQVARQMQYGLWQYVIGKR